MFDNTCRESLCKDKLIQITTFPFHLCSFQIVQPVCAAVWPSLQRALHLTSEVESLIRGFGNVKGPRLKASKLSALALRLQSGKGRTVLCGLGVSTRSPLAFLLFPNPVCDERVKGLQALPHHQGVSWALERIWRRICFHGTAYQN